ncbi:uncharacterized protein [Epargyreus clarus]|uniref:uncharacterized protein n=1 Tax=Epargyreus clarus TaxID=520877 RepID=UPI003C2D091D
MATNDCSNSSGRLFINDRKTKTEFLVDTGTDLCVFPHSYLRDRRAPTSYKLSAANGSSIATYGFHHLNLDLGLRRNYPWHFIMGDVTKPIIGIDFLCYFGLVVDCRNRRLLDSTTCLSVSAIVASEHQLSSVKVLTGDTKYNDILTDFIDITRPIGTQRTIPHNTIHHIRTTSGPPVSCAPRRLAPDKLQIAKDEFRSMLDNGTARPSESPWSSPLHLAPKKDNNNNNKPLINLTPRPARTPVAT